MVALDNAANRQGDQILRKGTFRPGIGLRVGRSDSRVRANIHDHPFDFVARRKSSEFCQEIRLVRTASGEAIHVGQDNRLVGTGGGGRARRHQNRVNACANACEQSHLQMKWSAERECAIAAAHANVEIAIVVPRVLDDRFVGDAVKGGNRQHAAGLGAGERLGKGLRTERLGGESFGGESFRAEGATGKGLGRKRLRAERFGAEGFSGKGLRAERLSGEGLRRECFGRKRFGAERFGGEGLRAEGLGRKGLRAEGLGRKGFGAERLGGELGVEEQEVLRRIQITELPKFRPYVFVKNEVVIGGQPRQLDDRFAARLDLELEPPRLSSRGNALILGGLEEIGRRGGGKEFQFERSRPRFVKRILDRDFETRRRDISGSVRGSASDATCAGREGRAVGGAASDRDRTGAVVGHMQGGIIHHHPSALRLYDIGRRIDMRPFRVIDRDRERAHARIECRIGGRAGHERRADLEGRSGSRIANYANRSRRVIAHLDREGHHRRTLARVGALHHVGRALDRWRSRVVDGDGLGRDVIGRDRVDGRGGDGGGVRDRTGGRVHFDGDLIGGGSAGVDRSQAKG